MGMIRGQIQVVDNLGNTAAVQSASNDTSTDSNLQTAGGCCSVGAQTPITENSVQVARIENGQQVMTVKVNGQGYSPAVLVVQKEIKTKIKFEPESLNYCNGTIVFPELGGSLDLSKKELETPFITPEGDFTFTCTMNMLHGYVKVVDDINKVGIPAIVKEVNAYKPQSSGSGGCCG
jgi:plastocyanin domain-containing protein